MLGEIPLVSDGNSTIRGAVAYVPQISWIYNATVSCSLLYASNIYDLFISALEYE